MILKKFVPIILVAFFLFSTASSQVKTNLSVLREAALRSDTRYQEMSARLASLAKQRNWPLFITLEKRKPGSFIRPECQRHATLCGNQRQYHFSCHDRNQPVMARW